jgi:hypothetical protein
MNILKQSTAATLVLGPFVDNLDGFTAETALSIAQADVRLSKNAGTFAQKGDTTAATHMENGYYSVPLSTTDTGTLGRLTIAVNKTGALPVFMHVTVVPANVYDSIVAGTNFLKVDSLAPVWSISGTTLTVKAPDGSTTQTTRTLTTDAAAVPIIGAA